MASKEIYQKNLVVSFDTFKALTFPAGINWHTTIGYMWNSSKVNVKSGVPINASEEKILVTNMQNQPHHHFWEIDSKLEVCFVSAHWCDYCNTTIVYANLPTKGINSCINGIARWFSPTLQESRNKNIPSFEHKVKTC